MRRLDRVENKSAVYGTMAPVTTEPNPAAEWWTTSEVAAYLGVQVATVTNYRKRGQMPAPDMTVGRTHMWRPDRIIGWHGDRPRPRGRRSSLGGR
jgi:Helix-turn-helix domain